MLPKFGSIKKGGNVWGLKQELMKVRDLVKKLKEDGWVKKEQKGSHLQLIHPVKKGKVTVPVHGGDIPRGTLNAILKQAGLK